MLKLKTLVIDFPTKGFQRSSCLMGIMDIYEPARGEVLENEQRLSTNLIVSCS